MRLGIEGRVAKVTEQQATLLASVIGSTLAAMLAQMVALESLSERPAKVTQGAWPLLVG